MALATKYRIEGTSDIYGKVTVNIKLDGYVGSVIPLEGASRNWIELKIGDNSNDISNPILAGKLTLSFYVLEDFETTEIGRSEANTYYVEVLDGSDDLIWAGWALPEEYKEAYHNTPYVATVVASDNLDELKNIPFFLQDGKTDLLSHIISCLNQTVVTNDIFESINIYSNGMVSTSADSPLKQARVTYNSFRSISESPKAYEVLSSILVPFFARIYQYRGWRIENILSKRSSYIVRQYSNTGTYIGQSTFDPLVKFDTDYADFRAFIQKSGSLSIRPALNNAEVYFNTIEPVEPTTSQGFQKADDWTSSTDLDKWTAVGSNITIERVTASYQDNEFAVKIPGRKTTLEQTDFLESDAINIATADYETINVEFAHYANYPSVVLFGTKPILYFEIVFTETSTGDVYNWNGSEWVLIPLGQARRRLRIDFNDRMKWRSYSVSIDRVPSTGNIKFRFFKLIKSGTEGVTELRLTAWKTNLITVQATNAALLLEGATTNVFTQYKGPSFPHIISDGTVLNAAGVMDVSNTLTATWARRGVTESLNIRRLFLLQWLTFNSKPTELLNGTIHQKGEVITPMSVIKDKDGVSAVRYVMTGYSFNLGTGIGSGNYRELVTVDANINAFQEFLDSIRLGDFFPQTINYNIFIGGAPGLSPGANPGQIDLNFSLNGDVRGGFNQAEVTPASIQNKQRLDITSLTDDEIVFGAVKDDPSQENMTNLRLSDIKSRIGTIPTASVIGRYDIDTSGTTAPVGTKDIRYNNATQISATQLFISDITEDNIDVDLFLSLIKQGSALVIQDRGDHLNYQTYEVSGTPTFASATWTFPVTFKDSGGTGTTGFANNHKVLLSALSSGSGGIGGTIASGQVAFGTALNTIGGSSNLFWDSVNTRLGLNTNSPTNLLDINGTARIRTISNLGSTATRFLVASATGVVSERTGAEMVSDLGVGGISVPQIISSTGTLNDISITSDFIVFTGSSVVVTGFNTGVDGKFITLMYTGSGTLTFLPITGSLSNNQIRGGNVLFNGGIQKLKYYNTKWYFDGGEFNKILDSNDVFRTLPTLFGTEGYGGFVGVTLGIRAITGTANSTKFFRVHTSSNVESFSVDGNGYVYISDRFTVNSPSNLGNTYNAIKAKAGAQSSTLIAFRVDNSSNNQILQVWCNGDIGLFDGGSLRIGTTTGTKIGTATSEKLSFWNATPIVQPTTAVASATLVTTLGVPLTSTDTFDGYTLAQIVKALRNTGLLA